ncbi:MAG: hypothetical protein WBA35_13510, partial [Litorimonas sp.]
DKTNDAFGLVQGQVEGRDTLWYSGGDIDASSYMVVVPSEQVAVACFANDPTYSCQNRVMDAVRDRLSAP